MLYLQQKKLLFNLILRIVKKLVIISTIFLLITIASIKAESASKAKTLNLATNIQSAFEATKCSLIT